mgnify:FL=1
MTRLIRLNEVQYAETEHQVAGLVMQGFEVSPLAAERVAEKPAKGKKEGAAASEGDERD